MLSNCGECDFYNKPIHRGDACCGVAPAYAKLWQQTRQASLPESEIQLLPIESCREFEQKLPYDLDAPCIRKAADGNWNLMNRIRGGWGETALFYNSLAALLETERFMITGAYTDGTGEFFTVNAALSQPHSPGRATSRTPGRSDAQEKLIFLHPVQSSMIEAVGYDSINSTLYIRFQNGRDFQYFGVSQNTFDNLRNAPSAGRYFNSEIKDFHPYTQILNN